MIQQSRDSRAHSALARPAESVMGTADSGGADNCYHDYAQTNAQDLMDLLRAIDADVEEPPAPVSPAGTG
jgi:hypothetical protein